MWLSQRLRDRPQFAGRLRRCRCCRHRTRHQRRVLEVLSRLAPAMVARGEVSYGCRWTGRRGQIAMACVGCSSRAVTERPDQTAQGLSLVPVPGLRQAIQPAQRRWPQSRVTAERYHCVRGVLSAALQADAAGPERAHAAAWVHHQPRIHRTVGGEAVTSDGRGAAQQATRHRTPLWAELPTKLTLRSMAAGATCTGRSIAMGI